MQTHDLPINGAFALSFIDVSHTLMDQLKQGTDTLLILLGAVMVLAMHAEFRFFLELGTVRGKNQVNAPGKFWSTSACRPSCTSL